MTFADEIRNLMKENNLSPEEISNLARDLANEITKEQEEKKKKAARFIKPTKTAGTAKPVDTTKTADKPKFKKEIHNIGPNITVTTEKRDDGTIIYTYEMKDLGKTFNPLFSPFDSLMSWLF